MIKIKKYLIVIVFVLVSVFMLSSNELQALALENKEIYVEEKIEEENKLPGGAMHKRVKAKSMVTKQDQAYIRGNAKEAGSANNRPIEFNKYYPQQVNVLEIPKNTKIKMVPWGVIGNGGWSKARVEAMASDYESKNPGWKVIAGVNGDFFDINGYGALQFGPTGTQMTEGEMYHMSTGRPMLGFNNTGEGKPMIGKLAHEVATTERPILAIYDKDNKIVKEIMIDKINQTPATGEIAAYFTMFDKFHEPVPIHVDNAYVVEKPIDTLAFGTWSVYGKGAISAKGKTTDLKVNQFAIVTDNKEITNLLDVNVTIRVQYEVTDPDFAKCDSIIGYPLNVMKDNKFVGYNNDYDDTRYPRNFVGYKEDGTIVMTVIDGRQPKAGYYGIAAEESCAIAKYYGMVNAYQMDGGGSATMVVLKDGELQVVNSPSDSGGGNARPDSNGILVAIKVPPIEYEILQKFNSLEFDVDVLEQLETYKELYIEINGKKEQVKNGKVIFTELNSNTDYVYHFFNKTGEVYEQLPIEGIIKTTKVVPEINQLEIYVKKTEESSKYEISCDFKDPDYALEIAILYIGDKNYLLDNNTFTYTIDEENLFNAKDWHIKLKYVLLKGNGKEVIDIRDCKIVFGNTTAVLDSQVESMQQSIDNLFE